MKRRKARNFNTIAMPTNIVLNILVGLFSLACIVPLILVVSGSFTNESALLREGFRLTPYVFSTDAYVFLFESDTELLRSYGVTVFITVVGTVIGVTMMALCAYPLSRKHFRYRNHFSLFVYFTMLFNGGLVPFYIVVTQLLNLNNTIWALIVPTLVSPMFLLILRTFMMISVPEEIIEAAKIDGASEFTIFARIVMKLAMPGVATIALFLSLIYWNSWFHALIFMDTNRYMPLQFLLMRIERDARFILENPHLMFGTGMTPPTVSLTMATAVLAIGPIVLAYPFFQRFFVKGLTLGAVKG